MGNKPPMITKYPGAGVAIRWTGWSHNTYIITIDNELIYDGFSGRFQDTSQRIAYFTFPPHGDKYWCLVYLPKKNYPKEEL